MPLGASSKVPRAFSFEIDKGRKPLRKRSGEKSFGGGGIFKGGVKLPFGGRVHCNVTNPSPKWPS